MTPKHYKPTVQDINYLRPTTKHVTNKPTLGFLVQVSCTAVINQKKHSDLEHSYVIRTVSFNDGATELVIMNRQTRRLQHLGRLGKQRLQNLFVVFFNRARHVCYDKVNILHYETTCDKVQATHAGFIVGNKLLLH